MTVFCTLLWIHSSTGGQVAPLRVVMPSTRANERAAAGDVSVELDPGRTGIEIDGRNSSTTEETPEDLQEGGSGLLSQEDLRSRDAQMLAWFREEVSRSNRELTERFKGRIAYLEKKVELKEKPFFKQKANERHFDRSTRYLEFILEIRSAVCEKDWSTAITTLDVFSEAIKAFQKDVITADSKYSY